jgi:3-hydroxy-9,10-secoandrosta-1,3,5(10)-triene-9,17-dione monooxygenase reductase component
MGEVQIVTIVSPTAFRHALGHFCTGVTVVTGLDGDEPVGLACQSFTSVSLDPALVLFCPGRTSSSWPRIRRSGQFTINVLAEGQRDVCAAFGSSSAPKFGAAPWRRTSSDAILLDGALAWIHCTIDAVHDGGDHDIVVGRVQTLSVERDDRPLLYFRGSHDLDHSSTGFRQGIDPCL